jgi:tripartite-type tricarboxylate transporter receptor subunit TctC
MIRYFLLWMSLLMGVVYAQENFYKGKTVTIVVGGAAGAGYDLYARLLSRHFSNNIPGNPNVIVTNMPGAGSHVAADYVTNVGERDGTVVGALMMGSIAEPLLKNVSFNHDPSKYNYIGSINTDYNTCVYNTKSGITSFQDVIDKEYIIGGAAPGSESVDWAILLKNIVAPKVKVITGYGSQPEEIRALLTNEIQIVCAQSYVSMKSTFKNYFESGQIDYLVQMDNENGAPVFNNVPNLKDFVKDEEKKRILEFVFSQKTFSRPYMVSQYVPQDLVNILRKAFEETMKDKDFIDDAKKLNFDTNYLSGETLQEAAKQLYSTPKEFIEKINTYYQ